MSSDFSFDAVEFITVSSALVDDRRLSAAALAAAVFLCGFLGRVSSAPQALALRFGWSAAELDGVVSELVAAGHWSPVRGLSPELVQ